MPVWLAWLPLTTSWNVCRRGFLACPEQNNGNTGTAHFYRLNPTEQQFGVSPAIVAFAAPRVGAS